MMVFINAIIFLLFSFFAMQYARVLMSLTKISANEFPWMVAVQWLLRIRYSLFFHCKRKTRCRFEIFLSTWKCEKMRFCFSMKNTLITRLLSHSVWPNSDYLIDFDAFQVFLVEFYFLSLFQNEIFATKKADAFIIKIHKMELNFEQKCNEHSKWDASNVQSYNVHKTQVMLMIVHIAIVSSFDVIHLRVFSFFHFVQMFSIQSVALLLFLFLLHSIRGLKCENSTKCWLFEN